MTLTAEQIQQRVNALTYPPGMTVTAGDDPWEGAYLRITYTVGDSYHPEQTTTLGITSHLSPNDRADTDALDRYITWRIWRILGHEAREQVQADGKPLSDPHAAVF